MNTKPNNRLVELAKDSVGLIEVLRGAVSSTIYDGGEDYKRGIMANLALLKVNLLEISSFLGEELNTQSNTSRYKEGLSVQLAPTNPKKESRQMSGGIVVGDLVNE